MLQPGSFPRGAVQHRSAMDGDGRGGLGDAIEGDGAITSMLHKGDVRCIYCDASSNDEDPVVARGLARHSQPPPATPPPNHRRRARCMPPRRFQYPAFPHLPRVGPALFTPHFPRLYDIAACTR